MTKVSLNGNSLKLIAAVFMLIDHIGYFLFPDIALLRIVGRISFPIFAFMIAEGCRYTKNKLRYFLTIFISAVIMHFLFFMYTGGTYANIFFTLSLGILLIYSYPQNTSHKELLRFASSFVMIYIISLFIKPDYGFMGCALPLFAYVCVNSKLRRIIAYSIGLIIFSAFSSSVQFYCLMAIPLLLLYNGKRGRRNMKYFFYTFYPLHLIVLFILKEAVTK